MNTLKLHRQAIRKERRQSKQQSCCLAGSHSAQCLPFFFDRQRPDHHQLLPVLFTHRFPTKTHGEQFHLASAPVTLEYFLRAAQKVQNL